MRSLPLCQSLLSNKLLRSKRIIVREAQRSEPSLKEKETSPRKQVQGDHEKKKKEWQAQET